MLTDIIILIWLHFLGDFILQTNKMAINKSKDNKYLLLHCTVYTIPLFWFGWVFALINGVAHFITDYFTSRATSHLHSKGERHWFFVVIGLDQAIHITTLVVTLFIFGGDYGVI